MLHRFVEGLSAHLVPGGKVVLSVSTELDLPDFKKRLQESRFDARESRRRSIPGETIYVYECGLSAE